jgi:hypothetical protein
MTSGQAIKYTFFGRISRSCFTRPYILRKIQTVKRKTKAAQAIASPRRESHRMIIARFIWPPPLFQILFDFGFGVLAITALASQAGTRAAINLALGHIFLAVDGERFVNKFPFFRVNLYADFVAAQEDNQVFGFFLSRQRLAHNAGVFSPQRETDMGVSLAQPEIVNALRCVDQIAERLKAENSRVNEGHLGDLKEFSCQDFGISSHVSIQRAIACTGTSRVALAANRVRILLASCAKGVAQVRRAQAVYAGHFARHVSIKADAGFLFELLHCFHDATSFQDFFVWYLAKGNQS